MKRLKNKGLTLQTPQTAVSSSGAINRAPDMCAIKGVVTAATMLLLLLTACGGGGDRPDTREQPPVVSIAFVQKTASVRTGIPVTLNVTAQHTDFSIDAPVAANCVKNSDGNAVTCTPDAANVYDVTVRALADSTKSDTARITALDITDIVHPNAGHVEIYGINNNGQLPVEIIDGEGKRKAFLMSGNSYIPISPANIGGDVYVFGVNNSGDVLGAAENGYFLRTGTRYESLNDFSGAVYTDYAGINNAGRLVGYFTDSAGYVRGFIKDKDSAAFIPIDHPSANNAGCAIGFQCGTYLTGINDSGKISGYYINSDGVYRGFIRDGDVFIPVEHPASRSGNPVHVYISGINNTGKAVGIFWDSAGYVAGFVTDGNRFVEIVHPDSVSYGTYLTGINDSGRMSGWFYDGVTARGFLINFEL